ncbi:MAG: YjiH family protein, partial [Pseudoalteromonas distincta]
MSQLPERSHYTWRTWFTFLVPSLIGVFLFMTPISTSQGMTIPIAVMAKA